MVEPHCENIWEDNAVAGLGRHPIEDYGSGLDVPANQVLFVQYCLRSKILSLWIKNSLTTDAEHKLRAFKTSYTYNNQYDGAAMLFVIVNMVQGYPTLYSYKSKRGSGKKQGRGIILVVQGTPCLQIPVGPPKTRILCKV